jgi:hypothetical protein
LEVNLGGQILETVYDGSGTPQRGQAVKVLFRPETVKVKVAENNTPDGRKKSITARVEEIYTENLFLRVVCRPISTGERINEHFQVVVPYGTPLSETLKVYPLRVYSKRFVDDRKGTPR